MNKCTFITAIFMLAISLTSMAHSATKKVATPNHWKLDCTTANDNAQTKCQMNYLNAETPAAKFSISIEFIKLAKSKNPVAIAIVTSPMNILLQSGIRLTPDKAPAVNLAYRSCHADINQSQNRLETSCIAPFQLNAKLEKAFKRGAAFSLQAQTLNGKTMSQTLSLIGFTKTFNALKKQIQ